MIDNSKNMGLPTNFTVFNGFKLVGGDEKAKDNVRVVLAFVNGYRTYYQDFCVNANWLIQAPISKVILLKNFLSTMFSTVFNKYVPSVRHEVTVPTYNPSEDRKKLDITTIYSFNLESSDSEVQFEIREL